MDKEILKLLDLPLATLIWLSFIHSCWFLKLGSWGGEFILLLLFSFFFFCFIVGELLSCFL